MAISKIAALYANRLRSLLGVGLLACTIDVTPVPAARPRVGKFGTYYPKTYKVWMKGAEGALRWSGPQITSPILMIVEQVCEKPKTTKRAYPKGDWDNLGKGPCDVLVKKGVLSDDDIIIGGTCIKRFAEPGEQPHTHISWVNIEDFK